MTNVYRSLFRFTLILTRPEGVSVYWSPLCRAPWQPWVQLVSLNLKVTVVAKWHWTAGFEQNKSSSTNTSRIWANTIAFYLCLLLQVCSQCTMFIFLLILSRKSLYLSLALFQSSKEPFTKDLGYSTAIRLFSFVLSFLDVFFILPKTKPWLVYLSMACKFLYLPPVFVCGI